MLRDLYKVTQLRRTGPNLVSVSKATEMNRPWSLHYSCSRPAGSKRNAHDVSILGQKGPKSVVTMGLGEIPPAFTEAVT